MYKVIAPGSQSFHEPRTQLVKRSSHGLVGDDLRQFVKRASHMFLGTLRDIPFHRDEVLAHLIAMGCTEKSGPNRNGDGFKEANLIKYHDTFTKYAYPFRDHLNKDPEIRYGRVIKSAYNQAMGRVELLVGYNGSRHTIEKNGGLLADLEIDHLNRGEDIPVSMSCSIDYDQCSSCGNNATKRADYCTSALCKHGGLAENIGRICSDGHHLHADNPNPRFFDISYVHRPADRIAYSLGILKSASLGTISGAELAEHLGITAPDLIHADAVRLQIKAANLLAAADAALQNDTRPVLNYAWSKRAAFVPPKHLAGDPRLLRATMQQEISLPVDVWLATVCPDTQEKQAAVVSEVRQRLPGVFGRLVAAPDFHYQLEHNPFAALPGEDSEECLKWASELRSSWGLDAQSLRHRTTRGVLSGEQPQAIKVASATPPLSSRARAAELLATQYALYKVAALAARLEQNPENSVVASLIVRQNHLS